MHTPAMSFRVFYSLRRNPDYANDTRDNNNINGYLLLSACSPPRCYTNIFLHILPDLILTKSKQERTLNIPITKIIMLGGKAGIHTKRTLIPNKYS